MSDWFDQLVGSFNGAIRATSANSEYAEQDAAARFADSHGAEGAEGIAAALGVIADKAGDSGSARVVSATQLSSDRWKTRHGGADVIWQTDGQGFVTGLQVQSEVHVYTDVQGLSLANAVNQIQAELNNYWNNNIQPPNNTPPLATPLGQPFTALVRNAGDSPAIRVPVTFAFTVQALNFSSATASGRETEMANMCAGGLAAEPPRNLVFVHVNNDNGAANGVGPLSWASGQIGSWSINGAPGVYAHEMGHLLGFWRWTPNNWIAAPLGHHDFGTFSIMGATPGRRVLQSDVDRLNFSFGLGEAPRRLSTAKSDFPSSWVLRDEFWRHPSGPIGKTIGHRENAVVNGAMIRDRPAYLTMANFANVTPQTPF